MGLTSLKVVVLRPRVIYKHGWFAPTLEHEPFKYNALKLALPQYKYKEGPDLEDIPGGEFIEMAQEIAKQNLPNLRIIASGGLYFWIERGEGFSSKRPKSEPYLTWKRKPCGPNWRMWPLEDAMADSQQKADIEQYLTEEDWEFLRQDRPWIGEFTRAETRRECIALVMYTSQHPAPDRGS